MTVLRSASVLLLAALPLGAGCGSPSRGRPTTPTAEPDAEAPAEAEEVAEARVGCDRVTAADAPSGDLDAAVRARVIARMAERWELEVSDAEVARAYEAVARQNELDEAEMAGAIRAQGLDVDTYLEALRLELLAARVVQRGVWTPPLTEEEIDAAYAEEFGEDPNESPEGARLLRERLARRIRTERLAEASEAWLETLVARWAEVETETVNGRCVERWPTARADAIAFEGNQAIATDALREQVAGPTVELGPDLSLPTDDHARILTAYYELGYLDANLPPPERDGDRWVIRIHEGAQHHIGEVRVIDQDAETPRRDSAAIVRRLPFATGDVFSRSQIVEGLEQVRERVTRSEGEDVQVVPETRVHDGVVDLDLVVVHDGDAL